MIARLMKREPQRTDADWNERTYPCRRWYCFRRSPSWRSFERGGKSWCDRHCPPEHVVVSIAAELVFELEAAEARVAALEEATEAVVAQDLCGDTVVISRASYDLCDAVLDTGKGEA